MSVIKTQRGAALLLSLIILTMLSLITVSSLQSMVLNEAMSSNAFEIERIFQAAETGIMQARADGNLMNIVDEANPLVRIYTLSDDANLKDTDEIQVTVELTAVNIALAGSSTQRVKRVEIRSTADHLLIPNTDVTLVQSIARVENI